MIYKKDFLLHRHDSSFGFLAQTPRYWISTF